MTLTKASAADFYPEMGMDPFYSSLNPFNMVDYVQPSESDTVMSFFEKFKKNKAEKKNNDVKIKKEKIQTEQENTSQIKENKENKKEENIVEVNDKQNVTPEPKKHLTRKELEKELIKEEREKEKALEQKQKELNGEPLSLKERLFFFKKKKDKEKDTNSVAPNIELSADYMEYFPERYEVEAIGNAKVIFTRENTSISANKIVFNYDANILTANEDVVLKTDESVTEGDFIRLDLRKPDGWIQNPVTTTEDIKLSSKEAYIYSDRIEEYEGVAKIIKDETLNLGARSFASYVDQSGIFSGGKLQSADESKGIYKLKAETIYIDAKDDHEIITVKNADLYLKKFRVAAIPSVRIVTNKARTNVETNIPEFGSQNMLGMYIGPAVVLNVPGGSTLKLAPILTYKDEKLGVGGIARFRNEYNNTEVAYGTSMDELLIRGKQKIAKGLTLNYSRYTNQNEWFLGYRMPKYSLHMDYSRSDYVKDLKLHFSQMYTAGVFVDRRKNHDDFRDAEGRFRWMTQTYKPVFKYENNEGNIGLNVGLVAQTSASVYTSGETVGLFRIGPALNTKVGPWNQSIMYYQTASDGVSPFAFDRYRYGRSNVVLLESLKVSKYLMLGYLASLAMNNDYSQDDLLQESRILVSVGPEYARITLGFDAYRHNLMFLYSMLVGTKDSDIEFKKSVINNPNKFGKKKSKEKKPKKKSYKKYLKHDIDINE